MTKIGPFLDYFWTIRGGGPRITAGTDMLLTTSSMILREGRGDRIVELLRIGRIAATDHNRLGPVEAVPVAVRLQNGANVEEKILVQFQIEGRQSCVFHGPYGFPREIE